MTEAASTETGTGARLRVLFVMGQGQLGGIETYCLRMCRELHRRGHMLEIWFVKSHADAAIVREFRSVARVRFLSRLAAVPLLPIAPRVPPGCDLVFTTGRLSLIFGAFALRRGACPPLVAGVFSQWEYARRPSDYKSRISHAVLDKIGWRNLVFCTEGCRTAHLEARGEEIGAAYISPLLVRLPECAEAREQAPGAPLKIVSVGSFTPFKTYNFTLPAVIAALRASGLAVEWTIFGDGSERPRVEEAIESAGVGDIVRLAGRLDYADFPNIVGAADLYIGAGTTLIEASALGVPALVALDDNPDATTPGFFCDRKGTYTSDVSDGEALTDFAQAIAAFAALSAAERAALRARSIARAQDYSIARAESEIEAILSQARPVLPRLGLRTRLAYMFGVVQEAVRVALGKGAYRVR